jgi:regulator of sigma D
MPLHFDPLSGALRTDIEEVGELVLDASRKDLSVTGEELVRRYNLHDELVASLKHSVGTPGVDALLKWIEGN